MTEPEQLIEVLADQQHRRAVGRQRNQLLVDQSSGSGIDAPGRLRGDEHSR